MLKCYMIESWTFRKAVPNTHMLIIISPKAIGSLCSVFYWQCTVTAEVLCYWQWLEDSLCRHANEVMHSITIKQSVVGCGGICNSFQDFARDIFVLPCYQCKISVLFLLRCEWICVPIGLRLMSQTVIRPTYNVTLDGEREKIIPLQCGYSFCLEVKYYISTKQSKNIMLTN